MACRFSAWALRISPAAALALLAALTFGGATAHAMTERIAAVVNDEAISGYDLEQRLRLVISSSGLQPTDDVVKRIAPQIMRALVEERLEIQEARKQKIRVDEREVDQALATVAGRNSMTASQIKEYLAKHDIDVETLKDQLRANLAWSKLVNARFGPRIFISDEDVKAELDRLNQSIAHAQYLLGDIVLRVDSPDQDEEVRKTAERLEDQLHQGAPFQSVAQQFSQASTAATGGDLGWVQRNQLAAEIGAALDTMSPGTISKPIRTAGAYHIVFFRNKREAGKVKPMIAEAAEAAPIQRAVKRVELKQLMLPLPKSASEQAVKAAMSEITAARAKIRGCGNVEEVAAGNKALKVANLPMTPFSQIAPFLQQVVMITPDGQASQPFNSQVGVHIIVVCRRELEDAPKEAAAKPQPVAAAEPEPSLPDRTQVENRLYDQQLSMISRRYLRDLRRDAVVEIR
jgi:peptidyl-prolyl cis-trans isomerase SurA